MILDISHHQSTLTVEQLVKWYKAKTIDGVILRATWGTHQDDKFTYFAKGLAKNNVPMGAYCYSYALSLKAGLEECVKFEAVIKGYKFALPITIDMEDADGWKAKQQALKTIPMADICVQFCEYFEKKGYYANIYASDSWFAKGGYLNNTKLDRFDKWVANWSTTPKNVKNYGMHQYTSDLKLSGYSGRLDANTAKYDFATILAKKGLNGLGQATVTTPKVIDYKTIYEETLKELKATQTKLDQKDDVIEEIEKLIKGIK